MADNEDFSQGVSLISEIRPIKKNSDSTDYVITTPYGQQLLQLPNLLKVTESTLVELGQEIERQYIREHFSQVKSPTDIDDDKVNMIKPVMLPILKSNLNSLQSPTKQFVIDKQVPPPVIIRTAALSSDIAMPETSSESELLSRRSDSIESITTTTTTTTTYRQIAPKPPPPPPPISSSPLATSPATVYVAARGLNRSVLPQPAVSSETLSPIAASMATGKQTPIILMTVNSGDPNNITKPNTLLKVISSESVINNGIPTKIVYVDQQISEEAMPVEVEIPDIEVEDSCIFNPASDVTLDQLENFAKVLKQKRIELGFTQGDLGTMIGKMYNNDFSQTTISRFEALNLSFKNMCKLLPILKSWLKDVNNVESYDKVMALSQNSSSDTKRRKRTSIEANLRILLEKYFINNPKPTSGEIREISQNLSINKEVIRIWFCNRRQKQKRVNPHYVSLGDYAILGDHNAGSGEPEVDAEKVEATPSTGFHVLPKNNGIIGGGAAKTYTNATLQQTPTRVSATPTSTSPLPPASVDLRGKRVNFLLGSPANVKPPRCERIDVDDCSLAANASDTMLDAAGMTLNVPAVSADSRSGDIGTSMPFAAATNVV